MNDHGHKYPLFLRDLSLLTDKEKDGVFRLLQNGANSYYVFKAVKLLQWLRGK